MKAPTLAVARWPEDPPPLDFREGVGLHLVRRYAVPLSDGGELIVPAGQRTDLSSIPRIVQIATGVDPWELGLMPPVGHDALYQRRGRPEPGMCEPWRTFTRTETDREFAWWMALCEIERRKRELAHRMVRRFGWWSWFRA